MAHFTDAHNNHEHSLIEHLQRPPATLILIASNLSDKNAFFALRSAGCLNSSSGSSSFDLSSRMATSESKADASLRDHVSKHAKRIIGSLPRINNRTRRLTEPLDPQQHPNFVYQLPNPTIATFDPLKLRSRELKPEHFYGIHSSLVVFAPSIYWNGQFQVCCPCCKKPAQAQGWNNDVRRICGLMGTMYLVGTRYRCVDCPGKHQHQM